MKTGYSNTMVCFKCYSVIWRLLWMRKTTLASLLSELISEWCLSEVSGSEGMKEGRLLTSRERPQGPRSYRCRQRRQSWRRCRWGIRTPWRFPPCRCSTCGSRRGARAWRRIRRSWRRHRRLGSWSRQRPLQETEELLGCFWYKQRWKHLFRSFYKPHWTVLELLTNR